MPYLLGSGLTDASGNVLQDNSGVDLGEPNADMGWLAALLTPQTAGIYDSIGMRASPTVQEKLDAIWAWLQDKLDVSVGQVNTTVNTVSGTQTTQGLTIGLINTTVTRVDTTATDTYDIVWNGTYGLPQIKQAIVDLQDGAYTIDDVINAIAFLRGGTATVQQVLDTLGDGSIVLPNPPPAGYGGTTDASAVWNYLLQTPLGNLTADRALSFAFSHARDYVNVGGVPLGPSGYFLLQYAGSLNANPDAFVGAPDPDFTAILAGDTVLAWLNRTDATGRTWVADATSGLAVSYPDGTEDFSRIVCTLTDAQLRALRGTTALAAPIWPGLANVTAGAPVALTVTMVVDGPMDGVLIHLTGAPDGASRWTAGGRTYYSYCGEIAFVADNGYVEPWQYLTWDRSVYCPRQMWRAQSAIIHVRREMLGTVTPWTIT